MSDTPQRPIEPTSDAQACSLDGMVELRWLIEEWPGKVLGHHGEMLHYTNESEPRLQWSDGKRWSDVPTVRIRTQPNDVVSDGDQKT